MNSLSWITSYREHICFQSLPETKMAWENSSPELGLRCLISRPVLARRDLRLWSHFMLRERHSQMSGIHGKLIVYRTFAALLGLLFSLPLLSLSFVVLCFTSSVLPPSRLLSLWYQRTNQHRCHCFSGLSNSCWLDSTCNDFCLI